MKKQNENESLEKDIIVIVNELFKKKNEEKLETLRQSNEDLKKKHENEIEHLKKEHKKDIGSLKKELYEKLEDLQQENKDLKKEHEKEILLLKKEVVELKEKLHAQTAIKKTNDNWNFVPNTVVNSSELEYLINTEITIKEETIE